VFVFCDWLSGRALIGCEPNQRGAFKSKGWHPTSLREWVQPLSGWRSRQSKKARSRMRHRNRCCRGNTVGESGMSTLQLGMGVPGKWARGRGDAKSDSIKDSTAKVPLQSPAAIPGWTSMLAKRSRNVVSFLTKNKCVHETYNYT
jgi:hypothetical protein